MGIAVGAVVSLWDIHPGEEWLGGAIKQYSYKSCRTQNANGTSTEIACVFHKWKRVVTFLVIIAVIVVFVQVVVVVVGVVVWFQLSGL